ncbi:citrate lyase beta subunit [Sphaerotilus natans subsp. natans DSM 6575]|uniref:Citrate lyase beta subunit n=2 Tax=Sphaerotilus natans TaxID=34103 RepID=A0A059KG11_9BURK|nr:CoA ester lyase [Sphaerotilus natans]KDB50396.1 citrate lyase beta subunit [Sphaerotilus natans subsp. natans DSM 6575]SIS07307.1 citrate lyase subunit beta / citryl-CoA lyase [Sphaerotilus natans]
MTTLSPLDSPLARARTLLFVPGNRPERFRKALTSGADGVVLDLEDSVPASEKPAAREAIAAAWRDVTVAAVPLVVRINGLGGDAGRDDLAWLASLSPPAGVMLAKTESASQLHAVAQALPGLPILPLIESAAGMLALPDIACASGVLRLVVGHIDFMADTGIRCSDDERELDTLRFNVAMQTRVNCLAPAIDGVTVAIDDDARLQADTRRALNFGFGAKLCIHPRQAPVVHAAMAPNDVELEWARRVLAADQASGGAAVRLDGRMVDLPVVLQARQALARVRVDGSA